MSDTPKAYRIYCDCCKQIVFQAERARRLVDSQNENFWEWIGTSIFLSSFKRFICERCFLIQIMRDSPV